MTILMWHHSWIVVYPSNFDSPEEVGHNELQTESGSMMLIYHHLFVSHSIFDACSPSLPPQMRYALALSAYKRIHHFSFSQPAAIVYIAVRGRQLYGRKGRCVPHCPHPHSFSQLLTLRYAMMYESPFSNLNGQS